MRFIAFAAVAAAFVLPDASMLKELVLGDDNHRDSSLPASYFHEAVGSVTAGVDKGIETINSWVRYGLARAAELGNDGEDYSLPLALQQGKDPYANLTIYQLISASNYTTKFAALVDKFPHIVDRLNGTKANSTLFVPVNAAFDRLPSGLFNDTKENQAFLESIVRYPVALGAYPYKRFFGAHTVPTALDEPLLGGEPQRLRVRIQRNLGLEVNSYSQVIAPNFIAKNGVIHAVDAVIVPPVFAGRKLALDPARYSTYLLAAEKTDFVKFVHGLELTGSTTFVPSNAAFDWLGPRINAFLFNTPRGLKYLEALLKYSVVPNATLYSDAYYGPSQDGDGDSADDTDGAIATTTAADDGGHGGWVKRRHYTLPTLLGKNATVSVNVTTIPGFTFLLVNDKVRVTVQDTIAKNGVIQEVGRVLFPPHHHHGHHGHHGHHDHDLDHDDRASSNPIFPWQEEDDDVRTVDDLIDRLSPYVDDPENTADPYKSGTDEISEL